MKPSEVAARLRKIAAGIDNSKTPDRKLVADDISQVLSGLTVETPAVPVIDVAPAPEAAPGVSPAAAAEAIQTIAAKLAASKRPVRDQVIHDIKAVIAALS